MVEARKDASPSPRSESDVDSPSAEAKTAIHEIGALVATRCS